MREEDIDLALSKLEKLGHDPSGWDTLYRDPATGALWEVIYPQSYMHGGGPRQFERDRAIGCEHQVSVRHPSA
jgi:hypothetical protein